ncbi:hypothetical protein ACWCWD_04895 [Streptomyces sp. NPDC001493]
MTRIDPDRYAAKAADVLHAFTRRTMPKQDGPGIAYPGPIRRSIGSLTALTHSLQQAIDHLGIALGDLNDAGLLTADHGTPAEHTAAAIAALEAAERAAHLMAEALGRAHVATEPLGYDGPATKTDDDL